MAQEIVPQKRIEWIDQLRGILFLFVIICHSCLAPPFLKYLYEPIFLTGFFFLSGYLYKDKDLAAKIKSIFNGLVAPFLLYSLLCEIGLYPIAAKMSPNISYCYHFIFCFLEIFS